MIPFSKPYLSGQELTFIQEALSQGKVSGNGSFTQKCHAWLNEYFKAKCLLTQSCTAAIEMSALLCDLKPGDEVIMPSYTFVSTSNAFVLRGATPVFIDIRQDTLNLDHEKLEAAITPKTKMIVPVFYAGVPCDMDSIMAIAKKNNITVAVDAAQAFGSKYHGKPAASFGHLSTLSFHDTKNIMSGEGGTLIINDTKFTERAEILWEKGTNRSKYLRGEVDKYSWVDVGSSFLPSEITAAILMAQLPKLLEVTSERLKVWQQYHSATEHLEGAGYLTRQLLNPQKDGEQNGHMFFIILNKKYDREKLITYFRENKIQAASHYVPLHSSIAGRKFGRTIGDMKHTDAIASQLLRLPLWPGFTEVAKVVSVLESFFKKH